MNCAECEDKTCYNELTDCEGRGRQVLALYQDPEVRAVSEVSARIESRYYMKMTRVQEVIEFAGQMGYGHLGMAFCIGLSEEARLLNDLLKDRFEVTSVCCKVCGIEKEALGLEKIRDDRDEAMCNPIAQAGILNEAGTELNLLVGLCVGHDILFTRNSDASVTTVVVKDRVLAHNPAGALYSGYHRRKIRAASR